MVAFRPARADAPPGSELLEAMIVELEALYGRIDRAGLPSATAEELAPPHGAFLVGEIDGRPVACGGLKRLEDDVAEIKRMFVVPDARGTGVARRLLAALEQAALELGYARTRLDTGPHQPHAQGLYESAGYAPIANFNANPVASFWGEKAL